MSLLVFPLRAYSPCHRASAPHPLAGHQEPSQYLLSGGLPDRPPRLFLSPRLPPFLFWSSFSPSLSLCLALSPLGDPGLLVSPLAARVSSHSVCVSLSAGLSLFAAAADQ